MRNNIATLISGLSIGILMGLSDTEILQKILIPILTLVIGILSVLSGYKRLESRESKEKENGFEKIINQVNLMPIMFLMVGIVIGAFGGLYAKNHDITSPKKTELSQTINSEISQSLVPKKSGTILHNISKDFCDTNLLCDLNGWELICQIYDSDNITIKEILQPHKIDIDSLTYKIHTLCTCQ